MFSGIIEATGTVLERTDREGGVRLRVRVPESLRGLEPGSSVCVNGACLTVVAAGGGVLDFDAVGATLDRTLLGTVAAGGRLNLERSLRLGGPVDGHLVTGHVDGTGTVRSRTPEGGAEIFAIEVPETLAAQIVPRGSVAVDGVSLTVAGMQGNVFSVSIVPYTLRETVFDTYRPGTRVHIETDVLAKYVEGALRGKAPTLFQAADTETPS
jgi:riboflavin synthase